MSLSDSSSHSKVHRYDSTFRSSCVSSWQRSGQSIETHAKELGIAKQTLHNWIKKSRKASSSDSSIDEVRRLESLLRQKDKEIALLKKAASYFARDIDPL
jgi:transposase